MASTSPRLVLALAAVLLTVGLAGCIGDGADGGSSLPDETGDDVDGGGDADATGAVQGRVLDSDGFAVEEVHVAVIGADGFDRSNATGHFRIEEVPVGDHELRADHPDYATGKTVVTVAEDETATVEIVMPTKQTGDAGDRPHVHDFWDGRSEVQIMDETWPWGDGEDEVWSTYDMAQRNMNAEANSFCRDNSDDTDTASEARRIWLEPDGQLIWPGSGRIEVTPSWDEMENTGGGVRIAYSPPDNDTITVSPDLGNGEAHAIEIDPGMWDTGHQQFSLWRFWICTSGDGPLPPDNPVWPGDFYGRPTSILGPIHVTMTLHKGYEVPPEPPHPRFWANGSRLPVVNERTQTYGGSDTLYLDNAQAGRSVGDEFTVDPGQTLVPPGTSELRMRVEWDYDLDTPNNEPWSLTYRPADMHPRRAQEPGDLVAPEPVETGTDYREYVVPLKDEQTDAYYQDRSAWLFYLNLEGREDEDRFVNPCGVCGIDVTVSVTAVRSVEG